MKLDRDLIGLLLWGEWSWLRLGRSLLLIYVLVGIFAYFFADRLIFQPRPSSYQDTPEILKVTMADGVQLSALYLPNPSAIYTILYSHGNAENIGEIRPVLEVLQQAGFAVFAYDYRGYGTSQGSPSERKAYEDIETIHTYLNQQLGVAGDRVIALGRSVGSGPSVHLALQKPLAGLILEGAFMSIFRVVLPVSIFPFDKFPNLSRIKQVRCPLLVIHGKRDRIIPFSHGEALYQAANQPKQLFPVAEADHNDLVWVAGNRYTKAIQEFAATLNREKMGDR